MWKGNVIRRCRVHYGSNTKLLNTTTHTGVCWTGSGQFGSAMTADVSSAMLTISNLPSKWAKCENHFIEHFAAWGRLELTNVCFWMELIYTQSRCIHYIHMVHVTSNLQVTAGLPRREFANGCAAGCYFPLTLCGSVAWHPRQEKNFMRKLAPSTYTLVANSRL